MCVKGLLGGVWVGVGRMGECECWCEWVDGVVVMDGSAWGCVSI